MNKSIGIWIDKREAKIVSNMNDTEVIQTIVSNIEAYNIKGGSGTKQKGGPQDVVQDSKYLQRENQQFKRFFEEIVEQLTNASAIVIFGPAQTGERLKKYLSNSYPDISKKIKGLEKAESMTDNQTKALTKNYLGL